MTFQDRARQPHVHDRSGGEALWFLDNLLTVKASRADGAPFDILENAMPAGSHTPMHAHEREDEAFYVLEGELTIFLGDERIVHAGPGDYIHVPAGVGHGFRTHTAVRMLVLCGGDGFVEMAREAGGPAERRELPPGGPPDVARLERACDRYGIRLLGPLPDEV
ncbi:MAG: cupin domain-containing protein [Alphaproteobacteria bacterium]|nr:cupin domain-containing protein [Myxococcales bacterium]MCB9674460.1 cupin domain-containing protein [Alphaproteobacteria bacterium]